METDFEIKTVTVRMPFTMDFDRHFDRWIVSGEGVRFCYPSTPEGTRDARDTLRLLVAKWQAMLRLNWRVPA